MSFSVEYDEPGDYIIVTVKGKFTLDEFKKLCFGVREQLEKYKCNKVLNDLSRASVNISITDLYRMPSLAREIGIPRKVKRALLVRKVDQTIRFLETVFMNRGNMIRVFRNREEALKWLIGDPFGIPGSPGNGIGSKRSQFLDDL